MLMLIFPFVFVFLVKSASYTFTLDIVGRDWNPLANCPTGLSCCLSYYDYYSNVQGMQPWLAKKNSGNTHNYPLWKAPVVPEKVRGVVFHGRIYSMDSIYGNYPVHCQKFGSNGAVIDMSDPYPMFISLRIKKVNGSFTQAYRFSVLGCKCINDSMVYEEVEEPFTLDIQGQTYKYYYGDYIPIMSTFMAAKVMNLSKTSCESLATTAVSTTAANRIYLPGEIPPENGVTANIAAVTGTHHVWITNNCNDAKLNPASGLDGNCQNCESSLGDNPASFQTFLNYVPIKLCKNLTSFELAGSSISWTNPSNTESAFWNAFGFVSAGRVSSTFSVYKRDDSENEFELDSEHHEVQQDPPVSDVAILQNPDRDTLFRNVGIGQSFLLAAGEFDRRCTGFGSPSKKKCIGAELV
jgi:hypothetical protein